jgi:hypothetical protein
MAYNVWAKRSARNGRCEASDLTTTQLLRRAPVIRFLKYKSKLDLPTPPDPLFASIALSRC